LKSLGYFIPEICGGIGKCGKCKVRVSTQVTLEIDTEERKHLDEKEIENGIRLACRTPVVDKMKIWIDEPILNSEKSIMFKQASEKIGAAIDIGTTTVVLSLVDLSNGTVICTESTLNPQIVNGADVISRIAYTGNNTSRLKEMQELVVSAVNLLIDSALKNIANDKKCISKVVVSGNTVMLHMFLGLDVQSLGVFPYKTKNTEIVRKNGYETGLNIARNGEVWILPSVSAFLGADIVSGVIETNLYGSEKISILLDLGTNGEIVGGNKDIMIGCSTAAGPAFEGASIKCGSTCVNGAIDKIFSNGKDITYTTIGNTPPKSICGSGIVDITAILIEKGIVLQNGRMNSKEEKDFKSLDFRIIEHDGNTAFLIAEGEPQIIFTQEDVRKVQLAKAATVTGIMMIMKRMNIDYQDIDRVYIAGNFGTFLNIENAVKIGLIPERLRDKIVIVGNSSVNGAVKCLLESALINEASKIQQCIQYFDIGSQEDFKEMFVENLNF